MTLTNSFDILAIAMLLDENCTSTLLGSERTLDKYLKHTVTMHTGYCTLRFSSIQIWYVTDNTY